MPISPTVEGFRAAFRRPSLALAEVPWRWTAGATACALLLFGLFEYLDTLPVTNGELLFLRTRHPYLVGEAIAHILRGSLSRVVLAGVVAVWMLACLWIIAASLGRIATVRGLLDYFREKIPGGGGDGQRSVADNVPTKSVRETTVSANEPAVARAGPAQLSAGRGGVGCSARFCGRVDSGGVCSPDADPQPGLAFLLFLPMAALVCFVGWALNWLLSLAGMFAVRDGEDAVGAISAAVTLCRERTGAVFAVSGWTGLAHLVAFVGASTVVSVPMGFAASGAVAAGSGGNDSGDLDLFRACRLAVHGAPGGIRVYRRNAGSVAGVLAAGAARETDHRSAAMSRPRLTGKKPS